MYGDNYQKLYNAFFYFSSSQEQTETFHHSLEQLYHTFFESFINQEHILLRKVDF